MIVATNNKNDVDALIDIKNILDLESCLKKSGIIFKSNDSSIIHITEIYSNTTKSKIRFLFNKNKLIDISIYISLDINENHILKRIADINLKYVYTQIYIPASNDDKCLYLSLNSKNESISASYIFLL